MSLATLPVRRPVGTLMFFLGVVLLGAIAWQRIPVELFPRISGNELNVSFFRPGSEPETVEREILMRLEARAGELSGVTETWGEVRGSGGTFRARFEPDVDLQVRELDLQRLAAELQREQPPGTTIAVQLDTFARILNSGFAMHLEITGGADRNSLLDLVQERIVPRLAAVPGVSQALAFGGAPRELTVEVDPELCAAHGIAPDEVTRALARSVQRLRFAGGTEDEGGRTAVLVDGRPGGVASLGELRLATSSPVLLRHVARVSLGTGREDSEFRVNGKPAVGLVVFQEEGSNLVRLGRGLRARIDELREEFRPFGIDFIVGFDAAELVEEQLDRLKELALSGFAIALVVLYLFLRQWRAVGVVGVAAPASLLTAMALLYLSGYSLNVITLFGLAIGIDLVIDNAIVVYEATQRLLERGASPDRAAEESVRRTARAIIAGTLTNAIVFLPVVFVEFEDSTVRSLLAAMAVAITLPMAGSVLVAVGLVPLLARRLAAPAAVARLAILRQRREELGGLRVPERVKALFGGLLTVALRRPGGWLTGVAVAVLLSVIIALPIVLVGAATREAPETDQVRLPVELAPGTSLPRARSIFDRLERAVLELEVERVETFFREDGGSITVHLPPPEKRPEGLSAGRVRDVVREALGGVSGVDLPASQSGGGEGGVAALLGQGPARVVISGPDAQQLQRLADDLEESLESIAEIGSASAQSRSGQEELRVVPDDRALQAFGLTRDQVLPVLNIVPREGVTLRTGFTMQDGREIPLTVRRTSGAASSGEGLRKLRIATPRGVLPLEAVAAVRRMEPPPTITHHDGRREVEVSYGLSADAPASGPSRQALDRRIRDAIQTVHRPLGYAIEAPEAEKSFNWFKRVFLPVLLLLYAVLAITFESTTLPLLVLLSLPLTLLGALWALVLAGLPADQMALLGAVALVGQTVNPAILLVDRMQQRSRGGASAGAAALAAVRERARPVLMTMLTMVVGLWPLALATGRENEIWPPFATVMMGGLVSSTALTLLVMPVGFVFLRRLDQIFGRLGPWILIGWVAATAAVTAPLVVYDVITSLTWQVMTTLLVASLLLAVAVLAFRRRELPEPAAAGGPPAVEVRYLSKTYGRPGPIVRAWRLPEEFAVKVLRAGARAFDPRAARGRILPLLLALAGTGYLARTLETPFWRLVFLFVGAALLASVFREVRRARGRADALGRVEPGGLEGLAATLAPWLALGFVVVQDYLRPRLAGRPPDIRLWVPIAIAAVVAFVQFGRRTALLLARGTIRERVAEGRLRRPRTLWRRFSRRVFGLDLPREQVRAVIDVHFTARRGMVGILGPNGAGKTTLLRMLAGILDPSVGVITLGGVPLRLLRRYLARYVGYLPQEFGLPDDLTAREYLDYYALLYEIRPGGERRERVERLLQEVGLAERADERIGSYSGGMRQRVAVARTLLRLPLIIIVDEPTVGLDPRERIRFRNLLARLAEGRVVLFSTHVVEDVAVACERVLVMARGRVVFDGPPAGLAAAAAGKVWEATLEAGGARPLPGGALVVDQVPDEAGSLRSRILSAVSPFPEAQPIEPSLEDGYLWLVGAGDRA